MSTVPLGLYIWTRIHQLGINHIFGVPGDFNLTLLDHIYAVPGLNWIGNTNELNAAYAADGYARVRHGAGCLVTTHGTSRAMQEKRMMIHHSIGFAPDHQVFNAASRGLRVAAAELMSEVGAAEEVDRVLREMFLKSGPVYLFVPIDLVDKQVPAAALGKPLDLEPNSDKQAVESAAKSILDTIHASQNPAIFVDALVQRYQASQEARELVDKLGIPTYTSNMGKGIIDETNKYYVGLYNGEPSHPGVASAFESHDRILVLGDLPSDTNSGGFTRRIPEGKAIYINPVSVKIPQSDLPLQTLPLKAVLKSLIKACNPDHHFSAPFPQLPERRKEDDLDSKLITQSWIWHRLAQFMQSHDVVFGETGTAAFGLPDATFPAHTHWITQTYYGSIGYATPAAFGAEVSLQDLAASNVRPRGRTILVTGDGSLMLTVQEIGNFIKHHLSPVIFVINNGGYTIERVIHGARQSYNDIVPFDYKHMLPFFSLPEAEARACFHRAETKAELDAILELEGMRRPEGRPQVVEVVMDAFDVPWRLATQIATRGPAAVKEMEEAGFKVRNMGKQEGFWN
ncbi:putative TPP enzyme family protein [Teratosphaeria destructans]|uniref:Pyruvate decarboxylase n=1 Tax=Teratosphaeria destructans TaxID=418781 RepID=A0A9W7W645_9PEZI|nr:putative TPP enzyme family protein [Teratosphaeria destructans]